MSYQASWGHRLLNYIGSLLTHYLSQPVKHYTSFTLEDEATLRAYLKPADILLVDGNQRISTAIKYLSQSTWSHAALYVGDIFDPSTGQSSSQQLIEANLQDGVVAVPISKYAHLNTRICRPCNLTAEDTAQVTGFMIQSLGKSYDPVHIFDLMRYLLPTPPVPARFRRRLLALGSGDPTRTICSTLIAQAFQSVRYPILPRLTGRGDARREILHIRHHSLFVPRDFDISPYFNVIKPELTKPFNYKTLRWGREPLAISNPNSSTDGAS